MNRYLVIPLLLFLASGAVGQTHIIDSKRESARSDKLTGSIQKAAFIPGDDDIKITINVPSFQMTFWQNGKEVKLYPVGVGMAEFPVAISLRSARSVEWNPVWIPPSSDWIERSSTVKAGEIVLPTDPRNPLGKVKIPLGYGYLLHQAKGPSDMGSLVSHGCIRVLQADLYDLAEKIVAARRLDVTPEQIAAAKRTKKTLVAEIDPPLTVEITYDTIVVENGQLHIYPDVYGYKRNTVAAVRSELRSSGVDDSRMTDAEIRGWIAGVKDRQQFIIGRTEIESRRTARKGRYAAVVATAVKKTASPQVRKKRR